LESEITMYGYAGKFGVVDLSTGEVTTQPLDEKLIMDYVGGRGFITRLIYDLIPPHTDPLGPDNVLMFAVGPLNGTIAPTSARVSIGAKSPLTCITGGGNAGGFLGANLKWAGFDGLIIRGRADEPVYLLIRDGDIQILPAAALWRKDTHQAERLIHEQCRDPWLSVAVIGQAGENCVPLATTIMDRFRSAGRGGLGAVMGSKNLKAVAVRGTGAVRVYDPKALWAESQGIVKRAIKKGYLGSRWKNGAYGAFRRWADAGAQITRNAQTGVFPEVVNIDGSAFNERARIGIRACCSCPMPCWTRFVVPDGPHAALYGEELTATTLKEVGARCGLSDLSAILALHVALDRHGLDTISAPSAIAFAMECYQRGIITTADTGGLELGWGDAEVMLQLVDQMAHSEGFGGELGQGVRTCAQRWGRGAEKYAFHVKGMEIVGTDPRGFPAWGLGYATSSRGACHMRAYSVFEYGGMTEDEMLRISGTTAIQERLSWKGKGKAVAYEEGMRCVSDSLEMCDFLTRSTFGFPEEQVGLIRAVSGREYTPEELRLVGERIYNLERLFNLREGLTPADDTLPERFLQEPLVEGASKGYVCPLEPMLEEYYEARDWDRETGYPSPSKLKELGL
jgi:aldehyde:ferredoxin oxidoreductase